MAKVGEGDQRWIVKDRDDGANCNNWHWTEKDILPWAKQQLAELLNGQDIERSSKMIVKTKKVENIEGDALVMNRKKKLICSFDLKMDIPWEGEVLDEDTGDVIYTVKGKMFVPDVDDTTLGDSMQVDVMCSEQGDAATLVIEKVRTLGRKFVRKSLEEFAQLLKDAHSITNKAQSVVCDAKPASPASKKEEKKEEKCVDELNQRFEWRCPPSELWDALVNPAKASAYTRSNVTLNLTKGGDFSYMGGAISGHFESVDAPKGFVMKWRLDNWTSGHYSDVTITLDSHEHNVTELKLAHTNIPYGEKDRVKMGWTNNFWNPIKQIFGFLYETK
eukprot:TRINITY_DN811_c3_g2_i1.p1 TRINITY_DN811_c3_g2~~TRINITY_DN811_c3_g2_i1.p1  ORF type:complete len:347 (+),score=204.68 TRINITY_DN811_c3_g2_i1:47-1042(+)